MERRYAEPERGEATESDMKLFIQSSEVRQFTERWHKEGYTKAGIHEMLEELYRRFSGDEKKTLERGEEILTILKHIDLSKFKINSEGLVKEVKKLSEG